jgi:hypothetical protein
MRRFLALLALGFTIALVPSAARAQCNEACVQVFTPEGAPGWGCVVDNDSGAACYARSTRCYVKLCWNAMVTDPSGQMLAVADVCKDEVTVRPVRRGPASRSAVRPRAPTRSAMVASASVGAAVRVG